MPTLDWIGKEAVVNHHLEVPYYLLKCDKDFSGGNPQAQSLLVQGDNLIALKALLPYYAGLVKCIYIDPPYNTGKESWVYNDNVNSPEIKVWFDKAVGKEGEDLSRHDKWLCMIYPRLELLKKFLSPDGLLFISIDDNEVHNLRILCEEIFGYRNFVAELVWDLGTGTAAGNFTRSHEYILCYARNPDMLRNFEYKGESDVISERAVKKISRGNPASRITFPAGIEFEGTNAVFSGMIGKSEKIRIVDGDMVFENGKLKVPVSLEAGWAMRNQILSWINGEPTIDSKGQKVVKFFFDKKGVLQYEKERGFINPKTILKVVSTRRGSAMLEDILGRKLFDFPKPVELLHYIFRLATNNDSVILDSFAGSGTTGQAVLQLNKEDGGNRRFILVEMDQDICQNVTAERLKRVINGHGDKEPLEGGFRYCKLGEPLFDQFGNIRKEVSFNDLAHHIFFAETGMPLPKNAKKNSPLIGVHKGAAYYLLFNGILGDKSLNGGNMLTSRVLEELPKHDGLKVIYGEGTRVTHSKLRKSNIIFKQVPYEIKTS